jgi:hypothetical protein
MNMIETAYTRAIKLLETNQIAIFMFFGSLFILTSFAGTRLFITDEGITLNQFYNFIHGSISIVNWKINTGEGVYLLFNDNIYGKFSYSLIILSMPFYYILKAIDSLYGAHLFLLQLWALSGGIAAYIIAKYRNIKYAELIGAVSYFILIAVNMYFFKPIYFPTWGELLSIEFTNILITSFLVLIVYPLFRNFFGNKIAIFASFFVIFATPISFYAITLKHHALSLLLTMLSFYFFYKYSEKKDNKFMYFAYVSASLCVWTRILDGTILLATLLVADLFIFRRNAKYIISILIVITISLMPFFGFNYLTLGNPLSIMEKTQSVGNPIMMKPGNDVIILDENPTNPKPGELMRKLGYGRPAELKSGWQDVLLYITFLKRQNTFGIFIISPFLIVALGFVFDRIKRKIRLNIIDMFFGLYTILFILYYKDYLLTIISDTPHILEYRYLLIIYIILLYFALRIDKIRDLIETKLRTIGILYSVILVLFLIYFIKEFPIPFMNIYNYAALITSISLIILVSINILLNKVSSSVLMENMTLFIIALSLSMASFFLLFYYWIVSIIYISPSQNFMILPVLQKVMEWMYRIIL